MSKIVFEMTLSAAAEAMVRANADAVCAAIDRAVIKTLSREMRASTKVAFQGEDFNGDPITDDND